MTYEYRLIVPLHYHMETDQLWVYTGNATLEGVIKEYRMHHEHVRFAYSNTAQAFIDKMIFCRRELPYGEWEPVDISEALT